MDTLMDRLAERPNAQKRIRESAATEVRESEPEKERILVLKQDTKELEEKLAGLYEGLRDGYHKECVKVYRNMQAAFAEEKEKQAKHLSEEVTRLEGKNRMTLLFSVMACVTGLGNLVLLAFLVWRMLAL